MKTLEKVINKKNYSYVNNDLTAKNFPIPKKVRTEGWKVIKMKGPFTSQEALDEIKKQGCTPANAYELAEWAHKDTLEKGTSIIALGQLWQDPNGYRRVPYVDTGSGGGFDFNLGYFGDPWCGVGCLLCFCDLNELGTLDTSEKNSDTLTLDPFDPVDIVYIKYRDELTGITCKHYGDTVTLETSNGKLDFWFKNSKKETAIKVLKSMLKLIEQK